MYYLYVHGRENSDFQTFDALYTCKLVEIKGITRGTYELIRMQPDINSVLRFILDES